jgi:inner membrane protein
MLVLGHTGITLGAAVLLSGAVTCSHLLKTKQHRLEGASSHPSQPVPTLNDPPKRLASWFTSLASQVDIRLLLIGSLLPDIIDKPLGLFFFKETLSSGRTIGHTLLFLILLTVAGLYLYFRHSKTWLLILSFGTLMHLILDQMWQNPKTLLWPFFGFAFEREDITDWLPNTLQALLTKPEVYVPELVGGAILIWFIWVVLRRRKLYSFIRYGQI